MTDNSLRVRRRNGNPDRKTNDVIDCPNCGIGFNPSYQACPRCNAFETPREERLGYFRRQAEEFAARNADRNRVRAYLIWNGLSDLEADQALEDAFSAVKVENRSRGCLRTVVGFGMLLLGGLALLIVPVRRGLSAGLAIGGLLAIFSGLYSMTTGKTVD